jgi:hypothetical protein
VSPVSMIVAFMSHLDAKLRRRPVKALRAGFLRGVSPLRALAWFRFWLEDSPTKSRRTAVIATSRSLSKPVARLELPFESISVASCMGDSRHLLPCAATISETSARTTVALARIGS